VSSIELPDVRQAASLGLDYEADFRMVLQNRCRKWLSEMSLNDPFLTGTPLVPIEINELPLVQVSLRLQRIKSRKRKRHEKNLQRIVSLD